jgi:sialate O-acetylesterase
MLKCRAIVLLGATFFCWGAAADVKLPAVFSDNMVLQKSEKAPFFGTADKGEKVTIKIGEASADATAGEDGKWRATLDTRNLPTTPVDVTVSGKNTLTIKNALVGEVWLASGQSNMEFTVSSGKDADLEIPAANWPQIRMFTVEKAIGTEPAADVKGRWDVCTPQTVGHFSAVGYFFARDLNQQFKTPVGVIHTSWGGTPAEAWTSREALAAADPDVKIILDRFDDARAKFTPEAQAKYQEEVKAWRASGAARNKIPRKPAGVPDQNSPTTLYNAMVAPLVGYGVRGAIWYQGESNAGRAYQYRKLFPTMITDWRTRWGKAAGSSEPDNFSFYWVQLANFQARAPQPGDSDWAELREAQSMTQSLPKTGQAVIIDIGDGPDIHPKNKQDVGRRLARQALKKDYDVNIVDSGPTFDTMSIEGDTVRVRFKNAAGGLVSHEVKLTGFAIAGEDKKFVWADAKIEGESVVLKSPAVAKPVAVRYAWANNPDASLYNKAVLPTCPFRTDDWPGVTAERK